MVVEAHRGGKNWQDGQDEDRLQSPSSSALVRGVGLLVRCLDRLPPRLETGVQLTMASY
jgi:hypothetical protein